MGEGSGVVLRGGGELPGDEKGDGVRLNSRGRDRVELNEDPEKDGRYLEFKDVNSWP